MRFEVGQQLPLLEDSFKDRCTCKECPVHPPNEVLVYRKVLDGQFRIDPEGQIWRCTPKGEILVNRQHPSGYLRAMIRVDGRQLGVYAHRLVWHHFNGPIPKGYQVNHLNGDRRDNRPSNLELVTPGQNTRHSYYSLGRGRFTQDSRAKGRLVQKMMWGQSP